MRTLFIPPLGTELVLAKPWKFTVWRESRNKSLIALSGLPNPPDNSLTYVAWWNPKPLGEFTFPKGTKLVVDRIYIRSGSEDFDSVTFIASDYNAGIQTGLGKGGRKVRFWARLSDVNQMVIK